MSSLELTGFSCMVFTGSLEILQTPKLRQQYQPAIADKYETAGISCSMLALRTLLTSSIDLSGPVNNSQMPAKICSIENILSH